METRQSLCDDLRVSNPGLIGCQNNLIPFSYHPSRYDICGTSIHKKNFLFLLRDDRRDLASFEVFGCCKSSNPSNQRLCGSKTVHSINMTFRYSIVLFLKLDEITA